jgi:NitT/TauT family transport system ATP-binding protein
MRLVVRDLSHIFPGKPPRPALRNLGFEVESGQFVAIIGPSGCGKSTLLRVAAGLLQPVQGCVELDGLTPAQVVTQRRLAWMGQSPALLPWLTVRGNMLLAQRFRPAGGNSRVEVEEALQQVGLSEASLAFPFMLSGGMQQRLALGRVLTQDAALWLMDEPFAALDELTREKLAADLLSLWQPRRPTVLWVTHAILEALRIADRILVISPCPGTLVADFPVVLPRPRQEGTPEFQNLLSRLRGTLGSGKP